jgi:hypothetical protein
MRGMTIPEPVRPILLWLWSGLAVRVRFSLKPTAGNP